MDHLTSWREKQSSTIASALDELGVADTLDLILVTEILTLQALKPLLILTSDHS